MDRLFNSLDLSGMEVDMDRKQFANIIRNLQEKNGLDNGAFKVIVSGGYSDNLESVTGKTNMVILNLDWKKPPEVTFMKGVHLIIDNYVRPNPEVKSLYYFNTLRLQKKLREYGAVDVLYHTDRISEASRANLFFVKGGHVFTPTSDILKGITRKMVLSMFEEIHLKDVEAKRLYEFDEIFMTSTTRDVTPVVRVEGKKIGTGSPGPVTKEIQEAFRVKGY